MGGGYDFPGLPSLDLAGYGEGEWPDPLAGGGARFDTVLTAWERLQAKREEQTMGYYRAGGMPGPLLNLPAYGSDLAPAEQAWGPDKVIRTPAFERGERTYRRTNVLNPRALRRAMRRVQGFAHFARKTIQFTHRVKMKKRRGRR